MDRPKATPAKPTIKDKETVKTHFRKLIEGPPKLVALEYKRADNSRLTASEEPVCTLNFVLIRKHIRRSRTTQHVYICPPVCGGVALAGVEVGPVGGS
jgi:hypothetical protein